MPAPLFGALVEGNSCSSTLQPAMPVSVSVLQLPFLAPIVLAIFLTTYGAVFVAEIVGDKLLYTTGVLATRYRPVAVAAGMALAFMLKMAVAVAIGDALARLSRPLAVGMTATSFVGIVVALWRKPDAPPQREPSGRLLTGAAVAFAAIFFAEWGDVGMVMAATMAARFVWSAAATGDATASHFTTAALVWAGAVAAMVTKGTLAVTLGAGARRWIADRVSPRIVRYAGIGLVAMLGILAILEMAGVVVD